jgi:hypothetical protein
VLAVPAVGGVPSGIIPPQCQSLINTDQVLNCYLSDPSNSDIAQSISWVFPNLSDPNAMELFWPQWPATAKDEFVQVFHNTVAWYKSGMTTYPGVMPPDPPPNPAQAAYMNGTIFFPPLDKDSVWNIYLGHVALTLAAEIYQWVPWGLHSYDNNSLFRLLSLTASFANCNNEYPNAFCALNEATPGNAISTFQFLKSNFLIGTTTVQTIGNLLNWARNNLWHFNGLWSPQNFYYNWQYWGYPPVSRVIAGTPDLDPQYPPYNTTLHHWTAGCDGTTSFLIWVLKAVNIPVEAVAVAGHTAPHFVAEDLYLTHGDDPYNSVSNAGYSATLLLISHADYQELFPPANFTVADRNVGRRPIDLAVNNPGSNAVLFRYCDDLLNNRDHASGKVYNEVFSPIYTVPDLEILGLWTNLDQAKKIFGCPAFPY